MRANSQRRAVVDYLERYGSITSKEANEKLGCSRLAAHICYLRKHGWHITTEDVEVTTRYGKATIARYHIWS